ncbi:BCCT family transporter [Streptomyces sp. NA02536]|uniref:BCCT family transporter n=1 Tax=Streptomyces sp. NA02536 TaxID=2742133 RepID=UPI0020CB4FCD|nr:BCCT family transporter [Streptomyces sp. NA02536]
MQPVLHDLTAVLTIALLVAGGVTAMEYATLVFALPVTVIARLVMASFSKALRMERAEREGRVLRRRSAAAHGGHAPERTWRQRLERMRSYPSTKQVRRGAGRRRQGHRRQRAEGVGAARLAFPRW